MTMGRRDETDMGGLRETFLTTHWSLIEGIQADGDRDRALIGLLLERYWKPVYCYLRRKGHRNEEAKDLTQGFFHEVVLNRHLVDRADPSQGRFRALLLHALNQYLIDERRKEAAWKRIPKDKLVPLDVVDLPDLPQALSEREPEDGFNYAWTSALLDQTLSEVEEECREQGMETHWQVFRDRVVQPALDSVRPPALLEVCARYGIEDESKASNMIITVKRRFQTALQKNIRITVASEEGLAEELHDMLRFLPSGAQDSENAPDT
jgi:DNA-directed RNA polymerase specialized sigma24 family protein